MSNANCPEKPTHWWREPWPWFLMALPLSAVIGSLATAWIAAKDPDPLVTEDYYKEGLAIHQVVEREAKATELGLEAMLSAGNDQVTLQLAGRIAERPATLQLFLTHPTKAGQDTVLTLHAGQDGLYRAALPILSAGKRRLSLEPKDRGWRLSGQWEAPFIGQMKLEALR